eukprot:Filipodium_phascolosomae@DN1908_c0_g1_i3.p1
MVELYTANDTASLESERSGQFNCEAQEQPSSSFAEGSLENTPVTLNGTVESNQLQIMKQELDQVKKVVTQLVNHQIDGRANMVALAYRSRNHSSKQTHPTIPTKKHVNDQPEGNSGKSNLEGPIQKGLHKAKSSNCLSMDLSTVTSLRALDHSRLTGISADEKPVKVDANKSIQRKSSCFEIGCDKNCPIEQSSKGAAYDSDIASRRCYSANNNLVSTDLSKVRSLRAVEHSRCTSFSKGVKISAEVPVKMSSNRSIQRKSGCTEFGGERNCSNVQSFNGSIDLPDYVSRRKVSDTHAVVDNTPLGGCVPAHTTRIQELQQHFNGLQKIRRCSSFSNIGGVPKNCVSARHCVDVMDIGARFYETSLSTDGNNIRDAVPSLNNRRGSAEVYCGRPPANKASIMGEQASVGSRTRSRSNTSTRITKVPTPICTASCDGHSGHCAVGAAQNAVCNHSGHVVRGVESSIYATQSGTSDPICKSTGTSTSLDFS